MNSQWLALLIALPIVTAPVVYIVGHLRMRGTGRTFTRLSRNAAFVIMMSEWISFAYLIQEMRNVATLSFTVQALTLHMDGLSLLLAFLILLLGTLVILFSGPYMQKEAGQDKYYAMLTAIIGSMLGLVCAADLFNLWVWFEGMAVTSYLLVAFYRDQPEALEACVKYLVQSAAGSVLVLLGIALVLAQVHSLDFETIRVTASRSPLLLLAGGLFIVGFGVKAALVPMHTWLPDAHAYAPSGISAMLSGVVIETGLVAMLRVLSVLAGVSLSWGLLLMGAGALNMLTGNLFALRQTAVKRMLAYSSLSHIGYMLLGLGIGLYAGQVNGIQGGLFHLFNHGLMKGLAFLAVGALLYALHIANSDHSPIKINELSGAAQRYPLVALTLSMALLGLAGLPPLAGFVSKWQIFAAGFATHDPLIDGLVIFAAFNSVLSLAYYLPLVNAMYRQQQSSAVQQGKPLPISMRVPLVALGLAVLLIGIWPNLMTWLTGPAGSALMQVAGR